VPATNRPPTVPPRHSRDKLLPDINADFAALYPEYLDRLSYHAAYKQVVRGRLPKIRRRGARYVYDEADVPKIAERMLKLEPGTLSSKVAAVG
jgi:hypothetical protein